MSIASEISRINANIAAAYTACSDKGAVLPQTQNSANLADTIGSIPQGGGAQAEKNDVNFYDCDGFRLYSYTFAQASALSQLPALPEHEGLTAQEWNHTLSQVRTCAQSGYPVDVGATFTTSDGSTRFYFHVAKGTHLPGFNLYMKLAANTSVTVDLGNGTTTVVENTASSAAEKYIEIPGGSDVSADTVVCVRFIGGSFQLGRQGSYNLYGLNAGYDTYMVGSPILIKVECGTNCSGILSHTFKNMYHFAAIILSNSVTYFESNTFENCWALEAMVSPKSASISVQNILSNCYVLSCVVLPQINARINADCFSNCVNLRDVVIPAGYDRIDSDSFNGCAALNTIVIPQSVSQIKSNAFTNCLRLYTVDLTAFTDPSRLPSLANANVFNNTPATLKFKVADQTMLSAFSAATNWSAYAAQFEVA